MLWLLPNLLTHWRSWVIGDIRSKFSPNIKNKTPVNDRIKKSRKKLSIFLLTCAERTFCHPETWLLSYDRPWGGLMRGIFGDDSEYICSYALTQQLQSLLFSVSWSTLICPHNLINLEFIRLFLTFLSNSVDQVAIRLLKVTLQLSIYELSHKLISVLSVQVA